MKTHDEVRREERERLKTKVADAWRDAIQQVPIAKFDDLDGMRRSSMMVTMWTPLKALGALFEDNGG